jgi:uncharacterized protein YbjT (DUF2867 family)
VKALVTGATGFVGGRLAAALAEDDVAYHPIHAMGRGGNGDFAARERAAARNFASMAAREGVSRVVYLGGLGEPGSRHLRSRHDTALTLALEGPPLPAMLPVPLLSPALSSLWIGLVTPVDAGVARPLIEGLSTETVAGDPAAAELSAVEPAPFAERVRRALA